MLGTRLVVFGAIAANCAIAVTKFAAAGATGSSAMLSEGIHSAVDTGNGMLLLVGMKLSKRNATPQHPFGHGKELYFWSLMVAVRIFGLGGGISVYEGVLHILRPAPLRDPTWNYVVLAAASPLSMYLGPNEILVTLDVDFDRDSTPDEIVAAVASIERDIRLQYPKIARICIEARSISGTGGQTARRPA